MKKNLLVFFTVCLSILVAIIPVAGSTGDGGSVTIGQPGERACSIGDTITFSGTNNASGTTYLFITGPNLDAKGSRIQSSNPHSSPPVTDGDASTFKAVSGSAGDTWVWEWNTTGVLIDAGMYTVYAASTPRDLSHVNTTRFDTVSFILKRPAPVPAGTATAPGSDAPVTITKPDNPRYYIGEDTITFSGTNSASGTTYLFLSGPNLDANGSQLQNDRPRNYPVTDGDATTFLAIGTGPDNRWSYTWDTHGVFIDAGVYTLFAASTPRDIPHINDTYSDRLSFLMLPPKDPALRAAMETAAAGGSATGDANDNITPPSVVMQGGKMTIACTANGNPDPGIAIWVIGAPAPGTAGYANRFIVHPDSAGAYSLDLDTAATGLEAGNYHVVVQHPMQNKNFDICLAGNTAGDDGYGWVMSGIPGQDCGTNGTRIFRILGPGCLQGEDAYEALAEAFNDPTVDDIIASTPSPAVTSTGSGSNNPGPQDQSRETPAPVTGGQTSNTAGSGTLLDQILGFLSGFF
jgi:hypothetical protein